MTPFPFFGFASSHTGSGPASATCSPQNIQGPKLTFSSVFVFEAVMVLNIFWSQFIEA